MPPRNPVPGDIFVRHDFCLDEQGNPKRKYLLVLASAPGGDVIFRLLTSRAHGRPQAPVCFHGNPVSGFFLGVIGDPLNTHSWLCFRQQDDYDSRDFIDDQESELLEHVTSLPQNVLCPILACVAGDQDSLTRQQYRAVQNYRAHISCP